MIPNHPKQNRYPFTTYGKKTARWLLALAIPFLLIVASLNSQEVKPDGCEKAKAKWSDEDQEKSCDKAEPSYVVKPFEAEVGRKPNTFIENTYLVFNVATKDAVIIDPGSVVEDLASYIESKELKVRMILNTHGHHDHIGGNAHYAKLFKASVYAHEGDAPGYEGENKQHAPSSFFKTEDDLVVPGFEFKVMHTPGHSPGSVCYYLEGLLFAGDTLFKESIGRTWGKTEEEEQAKTRQEIENIRKKLLVLPEKTKVFPGHGPSTTIAHEKRSNPFLQ